MVPDGPVLLQTALGTWVNKGSKKRKDRGRLDRGAVYDRGSSLWAQYAYGSSVASSNQHAERRGRQKDGEHGGHEGYHPPNALADLGRFYSSPPFLRQE